MIVVAELISEQSHRLAGSIDRSSMRDLFRDVDFCPSFAIMDALMPNLLRGDCDELVGMIDRWTNKHAGRIQLLHHTAAFNPKQIYSFSSSST